MIPRPFRALVVSLGASLALAAGALAEGEPTRPEYVQRLETICKPRAEATERAVEGVRDDIRVERLRVAAAKFSAAARIFGGTVARIEPIPRPAVDGAKLDKWFGYLDREEEYLRRIAAALRKGETIRSQRLTSRFVHSGNLANNVVIAFGFDWCSFKFSRFA